jgi:hypothetical protein
LRHEHYEKLRVRPPGMQKTCTQKMEAADVLKTLALVYQSAHTV